MSCESGLSMRPTSFSKLILVFASLLTISLSRHSAVSAATLSSPSSTSLSNTIVTLTRGLFDSFYPSPSPSPISSPGVTSSDPESSVTEPLITSPPESSPLSEDDGPTPSVSTSEPTPVPEYESPSTTSPPVQSPEAIVGGTIGGPGDNDTSNTNEATDDSDAKSGDPASTTAGTGATVSAGISLISVAAIAVAILVPSLIIYMAVRRRNQGFVTMPPTQQPNTYSGNNQQRQSNFTVGEV